MANLSGSSAGVVSPKRRRPSPATVESAVDTFLDVAAGFFEHLAHLAGLDARQFFFIFSKARRHDRAARRALAPALGANWQKLFSPHGLQHPHLCVAEAGNTPIRSSRFAGLRLSKVQLRFRRPPLTIDIVFECVGHRRTPRVNDRNSACRATFVTHSKGLVFGTQYKSSGRNLLTQSMISVPEPQISAKQFREHASDQRPQKEMSYVANFLFSGSHRPPSARRQWRRCRRFF